MLTHRPLAWLALAGGLVWFATQAVAADQKPAGVTVRGALVAKTATTLDVRPEDQQQSRRFVLAPPGYRLDPKFQGFVNALPIGSQVEITQAGEGGGQRTTVTLLALPGKWGKLVGTVTGIINGRLEVEDSEGNRKQYVPRYVPGGDKEMGQAIAQRHVGDRVEIRWFTDDWTRVETMRVLSISPAATTQPGFEGGTVVGKVVARDKESVTIKSDDGGEERYLPQRVVGEKDGLDKDVLKAIAAAAVGGTVEAKWFRDGERRIYSLSPKAASPARPTTAPDRPVTTTPPSAKTPEDQARDRLKLCQLYLDHRLKAQAKELLQSLIKDYPGTDAAKEAAAKLKAISGED